MKKILFCFSALVCLFLAAGCGRDSKVQYTLTYSAGANGSIDGVRSQKVNHGGTGSMVTAVVTDGYHFVSWSDGVTTASRTDSKVTADLTVTASFALNQYTLTYEAGENGTIDGTTVQTVDHGGDGSPVTAIPAEYHHFAGWSDGISTTDRTDRNVTTDLTVTANFAIDQYTLTYSAAVNGSIDGDFTQTVDHGGTGSRVTAVAEKGYHFVTWSDGIATADRTDSGVKTDLTVTAEFALNQYTLTYTADANGSIDGDATQTVDHGGDGSPVTAVAAEHHHFAAWSDGLATANRTDRKATTDLAVTAKFAIDQYTLTYTAGANGSIDGAATQTVGHGGTGSMITALPVEGYHFVTWSDGVTTPQRFDSKVTGDFAVTASYAINQYTLTYTAGENGSIDGTNPQIVDHGGDGSLVTAVAEKGYHFTTWSDDLTTAQRVDSKVKGDMTVSAVFEINTYTIGGSISGLVDGTQVVLQNNGGDDLTIIANGDFNFATELLDASRYEVSVLTQPTSPNQTCTMTGSSGTISGENVTDVVVTCILNTYTIGGTVFGLLGGDHLVIRNNEVDDLIISANGPFNFPTPLDDGSEYEVTVDIQHMRPNWTCDLENPVGTLAGMDVTDVIIDCYPEVVLQATAGIRKVKLNWNSYDFSGVPFNLCRAEDDISSGGFSSCQELKGGVLQTKVNSPLTVSQLTTDIPYWFQLEARYESGRQTLSEVVMAIPFGGLNDSGIDWCADDNTNLDSDGTRSEKTDACDDIVASHPGQDAVYGRDATARARKLDKTGTGTAGFDFSRLCRSGEAAGEGNCPPNPLPGEGPNSWSCTLDNVTGLIWEAKKESGMRSKSNTYTWYNPDETFNGGEPGLQNGGRCEGSDCDTQAYIQAVNDLDLCGISDWRLPTKMELLSIVDNGRFKPAVDPRFFPNTLSSYYWSSSPSSEQESAAWQVYFLYGEASPTDKNQSNHIRLVHGQTVTFGFDNP